MDWELKTNVTPEEVEKYRAVAVAFIGETKGWTPDEYALRYILTLADAPLAAFNAIRYDAREEMRQVKGFGSHPTGELQVFIHTGEMRAFTDYQEFQRIRAQERKKTTK